MTWKEALKWPRNPVLTQSLKSHTDWATVYTYRWNTLFAFWPTRFCCPTNRQQGVKANELLYLISELSARWPQTTHSERRPQLTTSQCPSIAPLTLILSLMNAPTRYLHDAPRNSNIRCSRWLPRRPCDFNVSGSNEWASNGLTLHSTH